MTWYVIYFDFSQRKKTVNWLFLQYILYFDFMIFFQDIQMIKETIDSLEDRFAKAADDRKGLADEVKIVETRRDADTVMSQQKMQKIGKGFLIICLEVVFEKKCFTCILNLCS